jgi:CRISPR-associated endonuclease/helicase Cas3
MVPGDTLVVPSDRGGLDAFGWNPLARSPVQDVAAQAAAGLRGRTWAVRVAPGLLAPGDAEAEERRRDALAEVLAAAGAGSWKDLLLAVRALDLPAEVHADLAKLDHARRRAVTAHTDLYGADARGRPRGVIFVARLGLEDVSRRGGTAQREEGALTLRDPEDTVAAGEGENVTENDARGSFPGVAVPLQTHSRDVELLAERFGRRAGLPPERVADLKLAGSLHDAGKADPRFQALLAFGDPLAGEDDRILAKSARTAPPGAARQAGLPPGWRHEALSVRLALRSPHLAAAGDPELVLWLIGTHHGWGRPFFPAGEDDEPDRLPPVLGLPGGRPPAEPGPQSLAFDWQGLAWADLYARLKERYGVWELARMEAILRLADHRASEAEAAPAGGEG